jgi:hypothetical protein
MLFSATVKKWEKLGMDSLVLDATNGTLFLLNGNRLQGLESRGSESKMLYFTNPYDHREKPAYIEATEATSAILTDVAKTWNSPMITFAFYTDNNSANATYTRSISAESILYVRRDPNATATRSYVCYLEGDKKKELLCPYSIAQVKELADAGDLTT